MIICICQVIDYSPTNTPVSPTPSTPSTPSAHRRHVLFSVVDDNEHMFAPRSGASLPSTTTTSGGGGGGGGGGRRRHSRSLGAVDDVERFACDNGFELL